jgi:hypothetical protein
MADNKSNITKEQVELQAEANRLAQAFNLTVEQQQTLLTRIIKSQIDSKSALESAVLIMEEEKDLLRAKLDITNRQAKTEQDLIDITKSVHSQTEKLLSTKGNLFQLSKDEIKTLQDSIPDQKKKLILLAGQNDLTQEQLQQVERMREELVHTEKTLEMQSKLMDTKKYAAMQGGFESATAKATEMGSAVDKMFGSLPGGGILQSALGLDEATDKLQNGVNAGFQAMNASIAAGGGMMGGLQAGMSAFNSIVMMNPLLLVVAAGTALFGLLSEVEKTAQEFTAETGLSVAQSKALVKETRTRLNLGQTELVNSEEILDVQKAMIKEFGTAGQLSTEVAASVAETAKMMGYSAEAAAGVQSAFEKQGASAADAAQLQETVALETFKAGVNTGAVMEDISQNSSKAAKYIKGGAKELAKAAVEAAKMGMNLESMVGVADGLLDIENSLTKQYEFQALTGKQLNLDKARELALDGDIAGASKEVLKQVGSIADFNKMNRLEKEALAGATGMEVDELQKTLTLQSKLGDLSEEQAAAAASLNLSAKELQDMDPEKLKSKIKEQQSAEKAKIAFEETIQKLKSAFLPLAETLGKVLGALMPVVSFIGDGFSAIGKILGLVLWPVEKLFSGLTSIMDMMGPLGTLIKGVGAALLLWWVYKKWIAKQDAKAKEDMMQKTILQSQYQAALAQQSTQQQNISQQVQKSLTGEKERIQLIEEENKALKDQGAIQQENAQVSGPTDAVPGGGPAGGKGLLGKAKGLFGGAGAKIMGAATGFMNSDIGGMVKEKGIEAMMGGVMGVGDLAIDPNGGPVVASPREGGIYQGTKNDGVSMSPGHGGAAGGGAPAIDYNALGAAVAAAIAANPPQINLDGSKVSQSVTATQSRNRGL